MIGFGIRSKTYAALLSMAVAAIIAGGTMVLSIERIKEDTDIVVALDRQRMLSQTMAKAAMGYVLARSGSSFLERQVAILDAYMTRVERILVMDAPVSSLPGSSSLCPAQRVVRQTNAVFGTDLEIPITMMSRHPKNRENRFQDAIDRQAFDWLSAHPGRLFSTALKGKGPLRLRYYAAVLSDERCGACHESEGGSAGTVPMAVRRFDFRFSGDIALGKAELEPSLIEYYQSRDLFKATLQALRHGGLLPLERKGALAKRIDPIAVPAIRTRLARMDALFSGFTAAVQELFKSLPGSESYRQARQSIGEESNRLRAVSEEMVQLHTAMLLAEQERRILGVAAVVLGVILGLTLVVAYALRRTLLDPLAALHATTEALAGGHWSARVDLGGRRDELGRMGAAFNVMALRLTRTIQGLGLHAGTLKVLTAALVELEQVLDKNIRTGSVLNRQAEGWLRQLERSLMDWGRLVADARAESESEVLSELRLNLGRLQTTMAEAIKLANQSYGVLDHARLLTGSITEVGHALDEAGPSDTIGHPAGRVWTLLKQDCMSRLAQVIVVLGDSSGRVSVDEGMKHPEDAFFDRWLATEGKTRYGHRAEFVELVSAHEEFLGAVTEALRQSQPMQRVVSLHWMERLERLRGRVFTVLDRLANSELS
ncbi:MAG: HAMP domain-containing protein [Magnetococcales bacterium]|nr:HAMP domain-containing protein [Magnetococcales bacterium]